MAKIIGFPSQPGQSTPRASRTKRPRAVDWTGLVHHSPWWRLADYLVGECMDGPLKLSASGELPNSLVVAAWPLRNPSGPAMPDHAPAATESEFHDLAEVRTILEAEGILESNRRSLGMTPQAENLAETRWQLWPILHRALRERLGTAKSSQAEASGIFKLTLPASLGYLRAVCWPDAVPADRLLDHLEPSLDLRTEFARHGTELAPAAVSLVGTGTGRAFLPYETDWFQSVVLGFAVPLGLVEIVTGESGHLGAWTSRSGYAIQKVLATPLLQSL